MPSIGAPRYLLSKRLRGKSIERNGVIKIFKNVLAKTMPTIDGMRANLMWKTVVDRSNDPFILSYKAPISIPKDKEGFDYLLMLSWSYDDPGCCRLPNDVESRAILFCTERLRETIDQHPNLVFLLTLSSDGLHQWVVATNDIDAGAVAAIEAFPDHRIFVAALGLPPLVILVERLSDPTWLPVQQAQTVSKRYRSVVEA